MRSVDQTALMIATLMAGANLGGVTACNEHLIRLYGEAVALIYEEAERVERRVRG